LANAVCLPIRWSELANGKWRMQRLL